MLEIGLKTKSVILPVDNM